MDCNCRCAMLQRARWALDKDELDTLKERAEFFGLDKTESFEEFKEKYLNVSAESDIINLSRNDVSIHNSIEHPIEQRNTGKGNPNAILTHGVDLNNRQKQIFESLPSYDSRTVVGKKAVKMSDLSALTAQTGDEFAMFTKGNERLIIRGNPQKVNINVDSAKTLSEEGYKWSGHTHPGYDFASLQPSGGDYEILKAFGQNHSVIYNSKGEFYKFDAR